MVFESIYTPSFIINRNHLYAQPFIQDVFSTIFLQLMVQYTCHLAGFYLTSVFGNFTRVELREPIFGKQFCSQFKLLWNKAVDQAPMVASLNSRRQQNFGLVSFLSVEQFYQVLCHVHARLLSHFMGLELRWAMIERQIIYYLHLQYFGIYKKLCDIAYFLFIFFVI